MIRGNHERELGPEYPLPNQPDIIVIRQKQMNYYIAHAGMLHKVFKVINEDINSQPDKELFAYKLEDDTVCFDAPLRQIIWSRNGLYSQRSRWHNWPTEEELTNNHACILHGHTPYCFFMGRSYFSYGDLNLFWENQHVFFSEDLQSFDLDSNIKGLYKNGETYRGLTCVCLEVLEEVAANNSGRLTREGITNTQNGLFYAEYTPCWSFDTTGDISKVLYSSPAMKTIGCDDTYGVVIK